MNGDLAIRRLSATLHQDLGSMRAANEHGRARVEQLLRDVAQTRLEWAVREADLPPGRWFIQRLELRLTLDLGRTDGALADQWARALVAAVHSGVSGGGGPVIRYTDDVALLADAVAGVATGQTKRTWIWTAAGLLRPGDPGPGAAPGDALLAMLRRHPQHAIAAFARAVTSCGVPPLDRALGPRRWRELAAMIPHGAATARLAATALAAGGTGTDAVAAAVDSGHPGPAPARVPVGPDGKARAAGTALDDSVPCSPAGQLAADVTDEPGALPQPGRTDTATPWLTAAEPSRSAPPGSGLAGPEQPSSGLTQSRLLRALLAGSPLAAAFARARLRPPADTLAAWAVLVLADADPASLGRVGSATLVADIGHALAAGDLAAPHADRTRRAERAAAPPAARSAWPSPDAPPRVLRGRTRDAEAAAPGSQSRHARPAHHLSDPAETAPTVPDAVFTAWAGLPFLLSTAHAAGFPDRVLDSPAFADRTLRWVVHAAGGCLAPVAAHDPALLALAGVSVDRGSPLIGADPPNTAEQDAVEEVARDWAAVTAARFLGAQPAAELAAEVPREPAQLVAWIAHRDGFVTGNRGWIEVHLPLAEVDLAIRRAGIDVDPGWVPWLGTVVRYIYE